MHRMLMKHMDLAFAFLLPDEHRQKRWAEEILQGAFSQSDNHARKRGRTRPSEQTQNFKNAGRADVVKMVVNLSQETMLLNALICKLRKSGWWTTSTMAL